MKSEMLWSFYGEQTQDSRALFFQLRRDVLLWLGGGRDLVFGGSCLCLPAVLLFVCS